ncbi:hypothetical protein D9M71_597670 [compost metagenome]
MGACISRCLQLSLSLLRIGSLFDVVLDLQDRALGLHKAGFGFDFRRVELLRPGVEQLLRSLDWKRRLHPGDAYSFVARSPRLVEPLFELFEILATGCVPFAEHLCIEPEILDLAG